MKIKVDVLNTDNMMCPLCNAVHLVSDITMWKTSSVNGLVFRYKAEFLQCNNSGKRFTTPEMDMQNTRSRDAAYKKKTDARAS